MTPDHLPVPYRTAQPYPRVSHVDRTMILGQTVAGYTASGWRVIGGDVYSTMLGSPPPRTNHILHLLLTVFSCGLWAPVWLLVVVFNLMQGATLRVWVDEYGRVATGR